jgi:hypothetical protein
MIGSTFIFNILDLLLDGDDLGKAARPQIEYLTDAVYDYTSVGLFVTFQCSEEIVKFGMGEDRIILEGVTITSPELQIGAATILYINKGIIDVLEIWSYDGEYPRKELASYILKQQGTWGSGREIKMMG